MGGGGGVQRHGALAPGGLAQQDLPVGVQVVDRLAFHPGGEALVEPEVVPPAHGDQIAEPLVGHLVGDGDRNVLAILLAGVFRVDQEVALEVHDGAPVLHGAEAAGPGRGDQVQLGQGIGDGEVVVVIAKEGAGLVEREAGLHGLPPADHDPDVHAADLSADPFEVPHGQEHQIARHLRGRLEHGALQAAGQGLHLGDRRVGDGHLARRRDDAQLEAGLDAWIVPHRRDAPRIGVLELGDQHPLGPLARGVVEMEQAGGEVVDLAGVIDGQGMGAWRYGLAEVEAGGLCDGIEGDPGGRLAVQARAGNREVECVQHDGPDRLAHLQLDGLGPREGQALGVGREVDPVADRPHRLRQSQRRTGLGRGRG